MIQRRVITIRGLVQGVGFRPWAFRRASALNLRGTVQNAASGVLLDLEGDPAALEQLIAELISRPPPQASVESVTHEISPLLGHQGLRIAASSAHGQRSTASSPDIATCTDCIAELFDAASRRFRYPFTTCTNCGPRLTIARGIPYDRMRTTMADFEMCRACRLEYDDPGDRRFHAQPISCWECGPQPTLRRASSNSLADSVAGARAIEGAAAWLRAGAIVAVKGLGGYHLACDAENAEAVARLRARKHREAKPFAIMVADAAAAARLCAMSEAETALLESDMRPIVLLAKATHFAARHSALQAVAPDHDTLGVMLPYTPLHHLLLADTGRALVMTSGNVADEPIAMDDDDATRRLSPIADWFLVHDRPIATRCDDSISRIVHGAPSFMRRSRGATPRPIELAEPLSRPVLAVGAHLKNTFCLASGTSALVSHHIGNLENAEAFDALRSGIAHYLEMFDARVEVIAHDLHPDYLSTRLAHELPALERIGVQHHHAHVASCLAEHGQSDAVIGVVFDGSGYGTDGAVWGGEFLLADARSFTRLAHLDYVALPGGDAAVREPWRMAASYLWHTYGGRMSEVRLPMQGGVAPEHWSLVSQMLQKNVRCVPTSSMGRLFDAVASLAGLRQYCQYEAQAAISLEIAADRTESGSYRAALRESEDGLVIDTRPLIRGVIEDALSGRPTPAIAASFHNAVCDFTVETTERLRELTGVSRVALTGGVFQNVLLTERIATRLEQRGFEVLIHRLVPCNDGGLSLGQAVIAGAMPLCA